MNYPKLFIAGCARSGTTWVLSIFANHPSVATIPESESRVYNEILEPFLIKKMKGDRGWVYILGRYDKEFYLQKRVQARNDKFGDNYVKLPAWVNREQLVCFINETKKSQDLDDIEKAELVINKIFDNFFSKRKKRILVEKTPRHLIYANRILNRYSEAKFIEVVRDGRDVCVSFERLGRTQKWCPKKRSEQIWIWKKFIEKGINLKKCAKYKKRILMVKYEDLKKSPNKEIKKMFRFAGIKNSDELVKLIAIKTSFKNLKNTGNGSYYGKGNVGDWKTVFSKKDIKLFNNKAGSLLKKLGYV